jgi:hypothetical protein
MTDQPDARRISRTDEHGRQVASAEVHLDPETATAVAAVHVEAGHRPPGAGSELIDQVIDSVQHDTPDPAESDPADSDPAAGGSGAADSGGAECDHVVAVLPKGDSEILHRAQERLQDPSTRSAGASVIVEGRPPRTP